MSSDEKFRFNNKSWRKLVKRYKEYKAKREEKRIIKYVEIKYCPDGKEVFSVIFPLPDETITAMREGEITAKDVEQGIGRIMVKELYQEHQKNIYDLIINGKGIERPSGLMSSEVEE